MTSNGERVAVIVQDNGIGFDVRARARAGLGLLGIEERVQELDGVVKISSRPNKGTTIRVELPVGVTA